MAEDISRKTVIMLVALTLVVSMVGTWAVLDEMSRVNVADPAPSSAHVKLQVFGSQSVQPDDAAAHVSLQIQSPEENNG